MNDPAPPSLGDSDARLRALLSLKRHEMPADAYFENLLERCQAQRDLEAKAHRAPARGGLIDGLRSLLRGAGETDGQWVAGGLAAYAAIAVAALVLLQWSADPGDNIPVQPVSVHSGDPAAARGSLQIPFRYHLQPVQPLGVPPAAPEGPPSRAELDGKVSR